VPDYLSLDKSNAAVTFVRIPERRDVPIPVDESLVVEFYNRLA